MFSEFAGDCKRHKTVVKVFLTNGGCIAGRIDQVGSEAIVMVTGGERKLVMKSAIVSICPDSAGGR